MRQSPTNQSTDPEIGKRIRRAFLGSSSMRETLHEGPNAAAIRTPFGVARDAHLPEDTVRAYIETHPEEIYPYGMQLGGRPLYYLSPDAWKGELRVRLLAQPKDVHTYTLDLISDHELRDMLPPEATNPRGAEMFWRNRGEQSGVWLDVGWKVEPIEPNANYVMFTRIISQGLQQGVGPNGERKQAPPLHFPGLDRS